MPGFFVSNIDTKISLKDAYPERCIKAAPLVTGMGGGKALCQTLNKFLQDKAFVKLGDRILILEGCLLNKADLFEKMGVRDVPALMASMYSRYGEDFFDIFAAVFPAQFTMGHWKSGSYLPIMLETRQYSIAAQGANLLLVRR